MIKVYKDDAEEDKSAISKTAYIFYLGTGTLFLFCLLTGADLARNNNIVWTVPYTVKTVLLSIVGGTVGGIAVSRMVSWAVKVKWARRRQAVNGGAFDQTENKLQKFYDKLTPTRLFICSVVLIVLAWLPAYLAFYPGICAYDCHTQTDQIESGSFNDHHPIAHTLLIKGALNLGKAVAGDANTGMALYTFLQLLFLGAVFAWGIVFLKKYGLGPVGILLLQAVCMFYPFHWYMSISVTKDIIFTGFFLLQILALSELVLLAKFKRSSTVLFFVSTVGMILFRNNGQFAFMVLLLFIALTVLLTKKAWAGKLFLLALAGFLSGIILLNLLFRVVDAVPGDKREMLSMPIQQLSRVMIYHGGIGVLPEDDDTLEEMEKTYIDRLILQEAYRWYMPHISDPVKARTCTDAARYRRKEFILTYLKLLIRYPGDFLNAALEINAGYLYPNDTSHSCIYEFGVEPSGLGYLQTLWSEEILNSRGIYKDSKFKSLLIKMEYWADENMYLKIPILKYLFVPGTWLWLYLLLFGFVCSVRKGRLCTPLVLVMGYFITLFLGPTVQLRYIYPVMVAYPFVLLFSVKTAFQDYGTC